MTELSYEQAKAMARASDPLIRKGVAERADIAPEILYYLAEDPDPSVRQIIARNAATPRKADVLLGTDADVEVRKVLAGKIARLVPDLNQDEHDAISRMTLKLLSDLARDQIPKVRQVIAETIKDMAAAPSDLIRTLARDVEISVSGPVLQYSPVLTDDDLLAIVASNPVKGALSAIARRKEVRERISDALVSARDDEAIAVLLGNSSAQIREETLDLLIEQAPEHSSWHDPLVRRPILPKGAERKLAQFVADHLLDALVKRQNMAPDLADELAHVVRNRLEASGRCSDADPEGFAEIEAAMERARLDLEFGEMGDASVRKAIEAGDIRYALAALATRLQQPYAQIDMLLRKHNGKDIAAVVWQAGWSADLAYLYQVRAAGMDEDRAIKAKPDGSYAMNDGDLEWQATLAVGNK